MTVAALVPRVRRALAVSSQYDSEAIPDLIRAAVKRLLKDYNFHKTLKRVSLVTAPATALVLGDQSFTLPSGFKKDLQVRFYDPADGTWSDPLRKREGFVLPAASGVTTYYWLEGTKLWIDTAIDTDGVGKLLYLFYQDMDDTTNEDWLTDDEPDAVAYLAITRGALDFRKPEVAQEYGALWIDERESLAIFKNELEWGNVEMLQREREIPPIDRYPTDAQ